MRVGLGYDVHQLAEGYALVLCGVVLPYHKGSVGHSDGDAGIHALCDAMLGALALGDIGVLYPDNDPRFKGIDSKLLLRDTYDRVLEHGYYLVNADLVIMLQAPKLRPHIGRMQEALEAVLGLEQGTISIKATTTERLGFVGEGKGIAAQAIVMLDRR